MILGWESSQAGCYSQYPDLTLSGKSQPILGGPDFALSPHEFLPARHEQPGSWPYNTPSPDPGAGSTAGAQGRMTSRQISHGFLLLVLLLLLIKARLVGISQPLCGVPSLCSLASGWLEVFRSNSWIGKSLWLVHWSWIHSHSQKPAVTFT